jgi:hypothetical protein
MKKVRENIGGKESNRMSKRKGFRKIEPTIAPGMDDQEGLEQNASEKEIEKGEFTSVTTLSFDEVDPS